MTTIHHGLNLNGPGGLGAGTADRTQASPGQTSQPQTAPPTGVAGQPAEVEITPTAQLLATLEQQIASTPDINQSRVDSIRQALSNGSYQIDAGSIADGVIAAQNFEAQATSVAGSGAQANGAKAFADTAQSK